MDNYGQKPPTICSSLNRAFIQPDNVLVVHSAGLQVLPSIARSLYSQKFHLTILVDFPAIEIQELNYYLHQIKQERVILQDDTRSDKPEIYQLNKVIREKRKKCYISGGIYALTTQVMLLDCLSDTNDLNVGYINRVIIRDGEYDPKDKYGLIVWLATLLSLNRNKTILTVVTKRPHLLRGDKLEQVMRLLFMKKIIMWPFGRSQIHKALQSCPVSNINHKLNLNSTQTCLHQCFTELMRYCDKSPLDRQNVQYACNCLLNYSKLDYLHRLEHVIDTSSDYSVWKSSNQTIIEIVDKIIRTSRNCVISLILSQQHDPIPIDPNQHKQQRDSNESKGRIIDLGCLIPEEEPNPSHQNQPPQSKSVQYKLQYELHIPGLQKIDAQDSGLYSAKLIQIINSIITHCQMGPQQGNLKIAEEQKQIQTMVCESLEKANSSATKAKNRNYISKDKSEYPDSKQKQPQLKEERDCIDLGNYRFDGNMGNSGGNGKQVINHRSIESGDFSKDVVEIEQVAYISTNSKQVVKNLHYSIFCYQHQIHYTAYLRKLHNYLARKTDERIAAIRKTIKRITNPSFKSNLMLHLQQEPILLQELYLELKKVNQIIQAFLVIKNDQLQRDYLFNKELDRLQLRYVNRSHIRLPKKEYSPLDDCILTISGQRKYTIRFCIQENSSISELTQNLRVLAPHQIFFYSPKTSYIRHLNIAYSQEMLVGAQKIHTIYFNNSIESDKAIKEVKQEDECFWGIAQDRKKLGEYIQNPQVRIKQLIIDDDIQKKARMISLAGATQAKNSRNQLSFIKTMESFKVERMVLIDKRQFKSLLPSYLFHHGFKVVPLFLENADYILSNDIGIEKKSVHTRDLHESLKSGRLHEQIKRLCSKFARPYLLIECPDISHFRKQEFSSGYNRVSGDKYSVNIRKQLIQILYKFPKINLIWSTSYMETVKYFIQLKKNKEQPDISKFKPLGEEQELEILEEDQKQNEEADSLELV